MCNSVWREDFWKATESYLQGGVSVVLPSHSTGYSADIHIMKLKHKNIWRVCQPMPVPPVRLSGLPQVILIKCVNSTRVLKEFTFYNLAFFSATGVLEIGP